MTVTIQKELAERIIAAPGTRDYGALSVWVQSQCDAEIVRLMPPSVFWPRPKVDSAILRIVLNEAKRAAIPDRERFHSFVRSLFLHRRKLLRGVLVANFKDRLSKPEIDAILASLGFDPTCRAEELPYPDLLRLCEAFAQAGA
jgi:16S rRNA (adenine1518-N6/adenine1519-N6)-dimethyltransferase